MNRLSNKTHLAFVLTLQALITTSLQANKIPEEFKEFNHTTYNSLPLSAEADGELKRNGRLNLFLEHAAPIVERYDLSDLVGFRLLHRHETIKEEEIMVESFGYWKEMPAFITTLEKKDSVKIYPASWTCEGSALKVFEFSTDPQVKRVAKKLGSHREFFGEIKKLLEEHQLEKLLAPAVLSRESFIRFDKTQPLYEIIKPKPYASVLINKPWEEIEKESEAGANLVRTTWSVGNSKQQGALCATYCHTTSADWKWHVFEH